MALELLARRAGGGDGRVPDDRQDLQGPDRRGIRDDDGAFAGAGDIRGMKWRSDAALGSASSTDVGTFTSGITNGTMDDRFGRRTMSAVWIRKGDGRISSVGWPPTTGSQNRNSPGGGRGSRTSSQCIPLLRGTRPGSSLDIPSGDRLPRPIALLHRGRV